MHSKWMVAVALILLTIPALASAQGRYRGGYRSGGYGHRGGFGRGHGYGHSGYRGYGGYGGYRGGYHGGWSGYRSGLRAVPSFAFGAYDSDPYVDELPYYAVPRRRHGIHIGFSFGR